MEEVKECYECCRENLNHKSNELNETRLIFDTMQEEIIGLKNELASYRNEKVDHRKTFYIFIDEIQRSVSSSECIKATILFHVVRNR